MLVFLPKNSGNTPNYPVYFDLVVKKDDERVPKREGG